MDNPDPKPGRWILPVLFAALVGLTYPFVSNIPQSPATTSTTLATGVPGTSTTTGVPDGTTTTLDPEVQTFVGVSDELRTTAGELSDSASSINALWESEDTGYGATRDALRDLASETRQFATAAGITTVPSSAEDTWVEVTAAAGRMATAADDMLDGLVNSPGPEKRRTSLTAYEAATVELQAAVDAAQAAAGDA